MIKAILNLHVSLQNRKQIQYTNLDSEVYWVDKKVNLVFDQHP